AFRERKKVCALDRSKARADAAFFNCAFVSPDCDRLFAKSAASFRDQHTFAATQENSRKSGAGGNHACSASTLGAGLDDCALGESAGAARLLAEDSRPLARTPDSRK